MRIRIWMLALAGVFGLAACGEGPLQRGASGAVIGGVAGEAVAGVPAAGAALGAGAGLLTD
jgi:hypothetical protein